MISRKNVFGIAVSAALLTMAAPASAIGVVDDVLDTVTDLVDDLDLGSILDLDGLDLGDGLDLDSTLDLGGGGLVGDDNASDTDANDNGSDTDINDNASDTDSNILKDILTGKDSDGIDIDDSFDGSPAIVKANEILTGSDSDGVDADGDNSVGSDNDVDVGGVDADVGAVDVDGEGLGGSIVDGLL
jgi:hypothetical protein